MFFSPRVAIVIIACLIIVGIASAVRAEQSMGMAVAVASADDSSLGASPMEPDSSFFQSSSSQTNSADQPAISVASDDETTNATNTVEQVITASQAALEQWVSNLSTTSTSVNALPVVRIPPTAPVPVDVVSAEAYLVGNARTGQIYLEKNQTMVLPVASMSKLITAIAATDTYVSTTTITITPLETEVPPDGSNLQAGEEFTLSELLYPMLLDSSNVAAEAIASSSDRAGFLELMSSYAWEIGMSTAYFADPTGLSEYNRGSPRDFFALARYLYSSRPDILAITRTAHAAIGTTTDHGAHSFDSIHPFVTDPGFIGGKTGHTDAAEDTMMTILNIDNQPIVFIVLRSLDRTKDTWLLIDQATPMIN